MNKVIAFIFIIMVGFTLTACRGGADAGDVDDGLDFRSVRDRESGMILSLGDSRDVFDQALGNRELAFGPLFSDYAYLDRDVIVLFQNNQAVDIRIYAREGTINRFEFLHMSFDVENNELDQFERTNQDFAKYFDAEGNIVRRNSGGIGGIDYQAHIYLRRDEVYMLRISRPWIRAAIVR